MSPFGRPKPLASMGKYDLVGGMVLNVIFAAGVVAVGVLGVVYAPTWPTSIAWLTVALLVASIAIPGYRGYYREFEKRRRSTNADPR